MKKYIILVIALLLTASPLSAQETYTTLSAKNYNDSPLKIDDAFIKVDESQVSRVYFDVHKTGNLNITYYSLWLTLYYEDESTPELLKFSTMVDMPNGSTKNVVWEIGRLDKKPVSGLIVPFLVELEDESEWNLREVYKITSMPQTPPVKQMRMHSQGNPGNKPADRMNKGTPENKPAGRINRGTPRRNGVDHSEGQPNPEWHREMFAEFTEMKIKIDGKLDDELWMNTDFYGDFQMREPEEGIPASEKTDVAMVYDKKNLFIGVKLYDSDPSGIKATEMRRDAWAWDDDYFSIIIDTFTDGRSGFYFTTNPMGIRIDGVFNDEGRNNNRDWDGVWSCKTSKDDKGWYIEMAIPWQTLRFKEGDDLTWNANFIRKIQRKNETDYWRLISRSTGHNGQYRVSQAGHIHGFNGLKMGGKFEILPYFNTAAQRINDSVMDSLDVGITPVDKFETDNMTDMGLDVKWNISSTMTADFTYNTDFAQVEADQEKVNLSRFSLFFPEKRDFFLEGAETFKFGSGGGGRMGGMSRPGNIQLFHSRQIGITDGEQVPILGGTRLNGRVGGYSIGLMSIQTEGRNDIAETNFSIARVKKDVFSRGSIGVMYLNKEEMGNDHYNRSVGFDSYFPLSQELSLYMVGAGSYSPENTKNNLAADVGMSFNSDLWQYSLSFLNLDDEFSPEIGYVRRNGIRRTNARLGYSPRPQRWKSIRKFNYSVNGYYQTDMFNRMLDRQLRGEFRIEFQNTSRFSINIEQEYEYLDEDWSVRTGHEIPVGEYMSTKLRTSYSTSRARFINGSFTFSRNDYYTGSQIGGNFRGDLKLFNRFRANLNYSYNEISLPSGKFHTNTMATRLTYSVNPDMFFKAYLQWYNDPLLNHGLDIYSANVLMHYIYRPGSDFYLVFNQENLLGNDLSFITNRTVIAKFTYFLRK